MKGEIQSHGGWEWAGDGGGGSGKGVWQGPPQEVLLPGQHAHVMSPVSGAEGRRTGGLGSDRRVVVVLLLERQGHGVVMRYYVEQDQ